jgi:hypothetical protein
MPSTKGVHCGQLIQRKMSPPRRQTQENKMEKSSSILRGLVNQFYIVCNMKKNCNYYEEVGFIRDNQIDEMII